MASFLGSVLLRIRCLRHLSPRRIHLDQKPTLTYSQSKCNMLRTQIIFSVNNEVECMFVFFVNLSITNKPDSLTVQSDT